MAKKRLIAGNWKMNNTIAQAGELINELKPLIAEYKNAEVCVCVPFTAIAAAKKAVKGSRIKVAAQNVAWAERGAFTGEISAEMLLEVGAEYVIIGHSERRQLFGETDESVNKRVAAALAAGLKPIICIGETDYERSIGKTNIILKSQLRGALIGVTAEQLDSVTVAYEPVWAIGTGKTATADDAASTIRFVRKTAGELYDNKIAKNLRILYGGSMNGKNCAELLEKKDIDGGLIGGASLKAGEFASIVKAAEKE